MPDYNVNKIYMHHFTVMNTDTPGHMVFTATYHADGTASMVDYAVDHEVGETADLLALVNNDIATFKAVLESDGHTVRSQDPVS